MNSSDRLSIVSLQGRPYPEEESREGGREIDEVNIIFIFLRGGHIFRKEKLGGRRERENRWGGYYLC